MERAAGLSVADLQVPDIRRSVLELIAQVPAGRVTTYGRLATALGDVVASRAVGRIIAEAGAEYPCHRVVYRDGRVGTWRAGESLRRLRAEGIRLQEDRIADLPGLLLSEFSSEQPLKALRDLQDELRSRISTEPARSEYRTVGAVDLSYPGPWQAVGAYVRLEARSGRLLDFQTLQSEINFPYIPSYLSFRELPVLLALLSQTRQSGLLPDVLMVDGNGILHPRGAGIASHLGVLLDLPTIGISKSLLCGQVDLSGMKRGEAREIRDAKRANSIIGAALKTGERSKPIFVSIGHRIDLDSAIELTWRLALKKLPEPIRQAHRACTVAAHPHA
ncbi:MAG TPA: hypothetical protein ENI60_03655 [Candidatus Fraserbacteria bacterium]|nr:hypothetical protein [Candidatus Fraserbacteria bacterium]